MNPFAIAATLLALSPAAWARPSGDIVERDTVRRTMTFADRAAANRLLVDNVNGSISVVAHDGPDVRLVAYRKIRAESAGRLEEAKKDVRLDIREDPDRLRLYVDAPWRGNDGSVHYRGWEYDGYDVVYDFELQVPAGTSVTLKTVNSGDIDVRGVRGDFEVRNVNGDVGLSEVSGSGRATTVNGDVVVSFGRNPSEECSFRTVNGKVDVEFPEPVAANFRLKTLNGDVYTDIPVKYLPQAASHSEKRGRKIYRSGESFVVEAGGGGPELSFDTLNGDIYLSLKGDRK